MTNKQAQMNAMMWAEVLQLCDQIGESEEETRRIVLARLDGNYEMTIRRLPKPSSKD